MPQLQSFQVNLHERKVYSLLLEEKGDTSVALTTKFTFNEQIFI